MGAVKAIYTELQELDAEVDFANADDVFDLVIDCQLSGVKLSPLMLKMIWGTMAEDRDCFNGLDCLWDCQEFLDGMAWHEA